MNTVNNKALPSDHQASAASEQSQFAPEASAGETTNTYGYPGPEKTPVTLDDNQVLGTVAKLRELYMRRTSLLNEQSKIAYDIGVTVAEIARLNTLLSDHVIGEEAAVMQHGMPAVGMPGQQAWPGQSGFKSIPLVQQHGYMPSPQMAPYPFQQFPHPNQGQFTGTHWESQPQTDYSNPNGTTVSQATQPDAEAQPYNQSQPGEGPRD